MRHREVVGKWICRVILSVILVIGASNVVQAQGAVPLPFGQTLFNIACNQSGTAYEFPAQEGDVVRVIETECYDNGGHCSPGCCCFDQNVTVKSGDTIIAQNQNGNNQNYCGVLDRVSVGPLRVTGAGPFTVSLLDNTGFGGGGYTMYAQRLNDPVGGTTLSAGDVFHAIIGSCGEVHTYRITASSGDRIAVDAVPEPDSTADPRLELFDQNGRLVVIRPDGHVNSVVCATGMYTLLVYSYLNTSGPYAVSVAIDPGNSVCSPASLPPCPTTTLPQSTTTTLSSGGTTSTTLPMNCTSPTTTLPAELSCQVAIASCDSDGDGNPDLRDRCPQTPTGESVNDAGCSLSQFCGEIAVRTAQGKKNCRSASWQNEVLSSRSKNRDCVVIRTPRSCIAAR